MCRLSWKEDGGVLGYCFSVEITCIKCLKCCWYPVAWLKVSKRVVNSRLWTIGGILTVNSSLAPGENFHTAWHTIEFRPSLEIMTYDRSKLKLDLGAHSWKHPATILPLLVITISLYFHLSKCHVSPAVLETMSKLWFSIMAPEWLYCHIWDPVLLVTLSLDTKEGFGDRSR